jgi:hypothetical protein
MVADAQLRISEGASLAQLRFWCFARLDVTSQRGLKVVDGLREESNQLLDVGGGQGVVHPAAL